MPETLAKHPVWQVATVAAAAAAAVVAGRYFSIRKVSAAERMVEALLDTEALRSAADHLEEQPEIVLAACANYIIGVSNRASDGLGIGSGANDPIGFSRTQTHPYTQAVATVLTESHTPEQTLTYAVTLPGVGEVRGTRRVGTLRFSGFWPAYPTPDTAQVTLGENYTAQIESEFELTEAMLPGGGRIMGAVVLRDNQGNIGRLNIGNDGAIAGTLTREAHIIGRFEGSVAQGARFKPHQIPSGE
jgi:hypothetical protein